MSETLVFQRAIQALACIGHQIDLFEAAEPCGYGPILNEHRFKFTCKLCSVNGFLIRSLVGNYDLLLSQEAKLHFLAEFVPKKKEYHPSLLWYKATVFEDFNKLEFLKKCNSYSTYCARFGNLL